MRARRVCPKCKKGTLDVRVHRHLVVKKLLFWMPLKRYMCYKCKRTSYIKVENNKSHA